MMEHGQQQHDEQFPVASLNIATLECLMDALAELKEALPMAGIFPSRAEDARREVQAFYRIAEANGLLEPHEAALIWPLLRLN